MSRIKFVQGADKDGSFVEIEHPGIYGDEHYGCVIRSKTMPLPEAFALITTLRDAFPENAAMERVHYA